MASRIARSWPFLSASLGGLALFLSDYPVHAWPLQAIALVPALCVLRQQVVTPWRGALMGLVFGLAYTLPLAAVLSFPWRVATILLLYLSLLWALMFFGIGLVSRWPGLWAAIGAGAVAAIVEWIDASLLPIWGTAQVFTRVWSAAPAMIQFVSWVGICGLVFVVVVFQALLAELFVRGRRRVTIVGLCTLMLGVALSNFWSAGYLLSRRTLRVAAIGWRWDIRRRKPADETYRQVFEPLARRAAKQGARLIASPEVGFRLTAATRDKWFRRFASLARSLRVHLAVGYFDAGHRDNRVIFFGADGRRRGTYRKTHLIPTLERYRAGDGRRLVLKIEGVSVGAMICQDDNFTDLARGYGRDHAALVVVPTNDWREVKHYHFENSRFRAVENGYAVLRAASNGISAIIAPSASVVSRFDHQRFGPGLVVADVPLGRGATLYSRWGDWWVLVSVVALLLCAWRFRLRRRHGSMV